MQEAATGETQLTRLLTSEERNDLRRRVLAGIPLNLDEAKAVIASVRQGQGIAAMAKEAKASRGKGKKPAMTDDALENDLKGLGL